MKRLALSLLLLLACGGVAFGALHFPPLTGRVVDAAHMLSASTVASLTQELADYENGTGNQVVVATLPSLEGDSIEDYGYRLGRAWGIGRKGKDNGALLIVAPHERKVRIEVGYGLEGVLTDAASSVIIDQIILPDFRAGHMEQGVADGTEAILSTLGGKGVHVQGQVQQQQSIGSGIIVLLIMVLFIYFAARHPFLAAMLLANGSFRSGGSNGWGDGGGFSGGGGSFGGGGASGGW